VAVALTIALEVAPPSPSLASFVAEVGRLPEVRAVNKG
jgi:hypothetical protein